MALSLILLLLGAAPGAPSRTAKILSARSESVSAVDASGAQRFGWVYAAVRRGGGASEAGPRAPSAAPHGRAPSLLAAPRGEDVLARSQPKEGHEIALAARWIDALPVKVDAQDGGVLVSLRMRGL